MKLTSRQQHALQSICDTFAPAADGWPSAFDLSIPAAIADALDFNPRSSDRAQLLQLLDLWDSCLHTLFALGRWARFSSLAPEARVRVLLSWADSGLGRRRAAFQALRKAIGFLYVMLPGANGARSPVWDKSGYPGPLGVRKPSSPTPAGCRHPTGRHGFVLRCLHHRVGRRWRPCLRGPRGSGEGCHCPRSRQLF
jgi:long-chain-alcohol oxidase